MTARGFFMEQIGETGVVNLTDNDLILCEDSWHNIFSQDQARQRDKSNEVI